MKPRNLESRAWSVYALIDPFTKAVRYVGWSVDVKTRFVRHLTYAKRLSDQTYRARWIRSLLAQREIPILQILESGIGYSYADCEKRWIKHFRSIGARLTNLTDGGDGVIGCVFSEHEIARRREWAIQAAKTRPQEMKDRIAASHRALGRHVTPENKQKLRESNKRRVLSPEQRSRLRQALLDRHWKMPPEMVEAMSRLHKGKTVSAETRQKLSAACKGRKHTEEERQRMRDAWAERKKERDSFPEMARRSREQRQAERKQWRKK